jgi:hypothetical protein
VWKCLKVLSEGREVDSQPEQTSTPRQCQEVSHLCIKHTITNLKVHDRVHERPNFSSKTL